MRQDVIHYTCKEMIPLLLRCKVVSPTTAVKGRAHSQEAPRHPKSGPPGNKSPP